MSRQQAFWVSDLQGMNTRQNMDKIPDNASPLLVNISLAKPGSWVKRKGSQLLGSTQAGRGVKGLIDYIKVDGTHQLQAVRTADIDVYGTDWTEIVNDQFDIDSKVATVNYKNRVYTVTPLNSLCYQSGASVTIVGAGANEIKGQNLAVAQNTLFLGARTGFEDRIYYSLFNLAANVPGDQFWEDMEGSLASSTRYFTVGTKNTALFSYSVTGFVYAFTENECYQFDIANADNATGVQKVFGIGCCGPRAITELNGYMIWMDCTAKIWAWGGAGPPIPLSWEIEDDSNRESIIDSIDTTTLEDVAAGSYKNQVFFSVGNISIYNRNYFNVVITGLMTQNLNSVLWSIWTFPYKPVIFVNAKLDSQTVLLFGAEAVDDIFQMNVGFNDVTGEGPVAVNASAMSKFYNWGQDYTSKQPSALFVKFRPQRMGKAYLKVDYSSDSDVRFKDLSDPDRLEPFVQYGVIDMFDTDHENKREARKNLTFPPQAKGVSHSIEFSNNQLDEGFEINGFGVNTAILNSLDIIPDGFSTY